MKVLASSISETRSKSILFPVLPDTGADVTPALREVLTGFAVMFSASAADGFRVEPTAQADRPWSSVAGQCRVEDPGVGAGIRNPFAGLDDW